MEIKKGCLYTCDNSSIVADVIAIMEFDDFIKLKLGFYTKQGTLLEKARWYKIKPKSRIHHWYKYNFHNRGNV